MTPVTASVAAEGEKLGDAHDGTVPTFEEDHPSDPRRLLIAIALATGYVLGAIYLGYLIATAAFVITFLTLAGHRNKLINTAVGVGAAVLFSVVFLKVVYISVPSGVGIFNSVTVWFYGLIGIY